MPHAHRPSTRAARVRRPGRLVLWMGVSAALVLLSAGVLVAFGPGPAGAASIGQLRQQIGAGQGRISHLSSAMNATSSRLSQLNSSIASLEHHIAVVEADLKAHEAQLFKLRQELADARVKLARLEAFEAHAEAVLSQQLVSTYERDRPDIV